MAHTHRKVAAFLVVSLAGTVPFVAPSGATVHEITASYCSGGGHGNFDGNAVDPPGLDKVGTQSFARPVLASGAVVIGATGPVTTTRPQVKVQAGLDATSFVLDPTTIEHPSEACRALQP